MRKTNSLFGYFSQHQLDNSTMFDHNNKVTSGWCSCRHPGHPGSLASPRDPSPSWPGLAKAWPTSRPPDVATEPRCSWRRRPSRTRRRCRTSWWPFFRWRFDRQGRSTFSSHAVKISTAPVCRWWTRILSWKKKIFRYDWLKRLKNECCWASTRSMFFLIFPCFPATGLSATHFRADWLIDWSLATKWT